MTVPVIPLEIVQGATFRRVINWYGGGKVCKAIGNLVVGCPTTITVTNHGLPSVSKTPVHINDVKGATKVNTGNKTAVATQQTNDIFTVDISTANQIYVPGTGTLSFYLPTNLTDYTARMQIRDTVGDPTVRHELTTEDGGITLSATDGGIALYISDTDTTAFTFDNAYYDLELIHSTSGDVTRVAKGPITLDRETTR